MKKAHIFILVALIGLSFSPFNNLLNFINERLSIYSEIRPVEKIYVHTDKNQYSVGESIWYKVYLTDGILEQPSILSEVAYVQILAPDNSVIETQKVNIKDGSGNGEIRIDGTQGEGKYKLKAYTNWMRNSGEFLFQKDIPVYDFRIENENRYLNSKWEIRDDRIDLTLTLNVFKAFGNIPDSRKIDTELVLDSVSYRGEEIDKDSEERLFLFTIPNKAFKSIGRLIIETKDADWNSQFKQVNIKAPKEVIDLQFFPEGGYLVEGMTINLAFKALGPDGLGREVEGVVLDESGKEVTNFKSIHAGMGYIPFLYETGKKYTAKLTSQELDLVYQIPEPEKIPYILKLRQNKHSIFLIVQKNPNFENPNELVIIGQSGGKIIYSARGDDAKNFASLKIDKKSFPEGITHFTVFSGLKPVNERLIFIEKKPLNLTFSSNKVLYAKRDKVSIKLNLTDSLGKERASDISVSAIDITRTNFDEDRENIKSHLLLTSDIKGYIEDPGYYFNKKNTDRQEHLDILLMTQGWTRFVWDSLLKENLVINEPKFLIEKDLSLPGKLTKNTNLDKNAGEGEVTLMTMGENQVVYGAGVTEKGTFILTDLDIEGKTRVKLFGSNKKGKPFVAFHLDSNYYIEPSIIEPFNIVNKIDESTKAYIDQSKKMYQVSLAYPDEMDQILLEEIVITADRVTEVEDEFKSYSKIYSRVDQRLDIDKLPGKEGAITILQLLIGRVPGLYILGDTFDPNISMRGNGASSGTPMFTVNGMITDLDGVLSIPPNDVDHIDVLKSTSAAIYGSQGANGVIAIYLKRGEAQGELPDNGVYEFLFQGYNMAREFYSPNYGVKDSKNARPDYRSTLYWNPNLKTNKNGSAEFEFYTSDLSGKVNIEVQGITEEGEKIFKNFEIEVNE